MNARVAGVLLALLAVLGGGALYSYQSGKAERPSSVETLGQPLLKGLQAAAVHAIHIRETQASLTLARKGERWVVAERADYPADLGKVRDFVLQAIALKVGQTEPIGERDRARLQLDASGGTMIEFRDAQGKTLASLIVGKKYFKREPENSERALGDGRFVLLPAEPGRVIVVSDALAQATAKSAEWIDRRGLAVDRQRTLEVRFADGSGWKVERADENAAWKLVGLRPGERLDVTKPNSASYAFMNLDITDVAPKDAKPEALGLDHPHVVGMTTVEGLSYTVRIGRPTGELYPLSVSVAGEPKVTGKDAEERSRKLAERLAHERTLEGHVLIAAKAKLEDVLRPRAELLEKPAAKK